MRPQVAEENLLETKNRQPYALDMTKGWKRDKKSGGSPRLDITVLVPLKKGKREKSKKKIFGGRRGGWGGGPQDVLPIDQGKKGAQSTQCKGVGGKSTSIQKKDRNVGGRKEEKGGTGV